MAEVTITLAEDGPYEVAGPVLLTAPDGTVVEVAEQPIRLCRCGESADKPFCDSFSPGPPPRCARQRALS